MAMPQMPTPDTVGRNSHDPSIDNFNREMRGQPWYQAWFRQQGLDPNNVHLTNQQRQQLTQVIIQQGGVPAEAFNDMKIDPAGNLNTEHGFASQPTWLKALEIGGAAAAGGLGAAALGGGSAAAGGASASATSGALGAGEAATTLGATGGLVPGLAAGAGAGTGSSILGALSTGSRLANGVLQTRAQNRAAQTEFGLDQDRSKLQAAQLGLQADRQRTGQLAGVDLSQHLNPLTDPRASKFGQPQGLSPDLLKMIKERAGNALQTGSDVPQLSTMPQPGKADSFLNALNYAGVGLDAWKKYRGGGL